MELKDIVGKEFICFEFQSDKLLKFNDYKNYVGLKGLVKKINKYYPEYALVIIIDVNGIKQELHYPANMILKQLKEVEKEQNQSIDDILIELKQLTSQI
jgi:hypothetical protein